MEKMAKLRSFFIVAIAVICIAAIFLADRANVSALSPSSVAGLATLKAMAQQSVPYDIALNNNKATLLEFYADWCTTCQAMAPTLSKLHQEYGEAIDFVMLNVDDPQWKQPIKIYHVTGVPQFTLLNSDQAVAQTFVGKVPEKAIATALAQSS